MTIQPAAEAFPLPAGYTVRPTVLDDAQEAVRILNAMTRAFGQPEQPTPDEQRSSWTEPGFDLGDSSITVLDQAGTMVAIATLKDVRQPPVYPWLMWRALPEHMETGLVEYLFGWMEQKAQRVIERCPPDARIAFRTYTMPEHEPVVRLYETLGYQQIRSDFRMVIHMEEAPPQPAVAEGFFIRTYRHPDELDDLIRADDAGFSDHWGFVQQPFEQNRAEWEHWLSTDPLFDPTLFFLAIEEATGNIAAISLCRSEQEGDPSVAYVDSLAVLRPYRKRGLATALLYHSFGEFWRRGRTSVALHVDSQSLTGATRLYEKVGMHRDQVWSDYEKLVRDGVELATTSIEEA